MPLIYQFKCRTERLERRNVLTTILHSFILASVVTVLWAVYGYSLVFAEGGPFLGGLAHLFLRNVGSEPNAGYAATIPHQTFMVFQLMFAVITQALITGAFAERIKFSAMLVFTVLWTSLIYLPLAHMFGEQADTSLQPLGAVSPPSISPEVQWCTSRQG